MLKFAGVWIRPAILAVACLLICSTSPTHAQSAFNLAKQSLAICEYNQWGVDGASKVAYLIGQVRLLFNGQSSFAGLSRDLLSSKDLLRNDCTGKTPGIDAYEVELPPWTSSFRIDLIGLSHSECERFVDSGPLAAVLNTRSDRSANDGSIMLLVNGIETVPGRASKVCSISLLEKPPIIHDFIKGRNVVSFITR